MAKLILKMAISLDGMVADPDGGVSWMSEFADEEERRNEISALWDVQAHLMGSRTFNDMKTYWPTTEGPVAEAMNALPKIAFSRRGLEAADTTKSLKEGLESRAARGGETERSEHAETWENSEVLSGPLDEEFERLKEREGKPLMIHGGASFARSAVTTGLIDELWFTVHPVALGSGLAIFDGLVNLMRFEVQS